MNNIDLNKIIASAYSTLMEIQNAATETVGTECLWARATPVINSEDVVLQEYTLTNIGLECPKPINVIVNNGDYNAGNYTIDLFGLNYEQPLEISIDINEWYKNFDRNTQPQKDDIVYVQIYHKLFEVKTSQVIYSLAAMPTYFKCSLSKYNPTASRKETEEFRESIEDLTVTQEELFGDKISQEVADNNATVETAYNTTTYVDPLKDYDIDSIISKQVYGVENKLISNAYYNFNIANKNIKYHTDLIYETTSERNHLIFSCWCKTENNKITTANIKQLKLFSKDSQNWYFIINTTLKLNIGDNITITRGNLLKVNGIVTELLCVEGFGIAIRTNDMLKANKKLTKWYDNCSVLKIYKSNNLNLIRGYDENDKIIFDLSYKINEIYIQFNNIIKTVNLTLDLTSWHYFLFDISPNNIRLIISELCNIELNKLYDKIIYDNNINIELPDFNVNYFTIENTGVDFQICNIRLYENEYEIGDLYKQDMYSPVTRNESKLILIDNPNIPNKDIFISPVK